MKAWLLLAAFSLTYNENQGQKAKEKNLKYLNFGLEGIMCKGGTKRGVAARHYQHRLKV